MKIVIAGSRSFHDYQLLCQTLAPERPRITQVITGGARGADQLGYRWAWKHQVKHQLFRADWERFGKSAGMRRNYQMAQAGDLLLAFWDGRSAGTQHMISCMQQLRRFAKISCLFEWLIGYHLYYAERNDTSHQSQVCSARTALGRTDTSPLGGCRSPSDRTRRDHLCCRGDWAVTDDHSCGLKRA